MIKKRVRFGEFDIPIPDGHEKVEDRDDTTEYLFIHAPREIYTVCFCSAMPPYDNGILKSFPAAGTLEIKLPDRRIVFFCPTGRGDRKDGLWYFNLEFEGDKGRLILPGQIMVNSDEVYRKTVGGRLPFMDVLENIHLNSNYRINTCAV